MVGYRFWIEDGCKLADSAIEHELLVVENERYERGGAVRVTSGPLGTEIKWAMFSPCFSSLYAALAWLPKASAPIVLRFNLSGWFEEMFSTATAAMARIETILAKSEIYVSKHTYVEERDPALKYLPPVLLQAWHDQSAPREDAVECVFDHDLKRFRVRHIGPRSAIAKIYGLSPASFPCRNGGSYDDIISAAYSAVLDSGRSRYDHVFAALRTPDNITRWAPYQRIVMPVPGQGRGAAVCVVSEISEVAISVI